MEKSGVGDMTARETSGLRIGVICRRPDGYSIAVPRLHLSRPAHDPETAHAPEFRYLASWVDLQIRLACRHLGWEPGGPGDAPAPGDRVLHLGNPRLLVGQWTLEALGRAIDGGAAVAAPHALAGLPSLPPVHTLRGFERLEEHVLGRGPETSMGPAGPLWLASIEAMEAVEAAGGSAPDGPVFCAGLYHEFVDYYGVVREDGLEHVPEGVERVLEVGCGRGVTGALLQERLGCRVTGVELNPVVAREAATRLHRVVTANVEEVDPEELFDDGEPFDLVFAFELFEHLAEPERFLEMARRLLKPGGTILLSTPNVGHHSVVLDLLAGRWDYLPIGLLCYTHLRFFTARTLDDWLRRLGFDDFDLIPQKTEEAAQIETLEELAGRGVLEIDRESLRTSGFYVRIRV
jgi:SAM-dependent methyltransferase